jgi:hypothetical protein
MRFACRVIQFNRSKWDVGKDAGPVLNAHRAGLNIRKGLSAFAAESMRALAATQDAHYRKQLTNESSFYAIRKLGLSIRNQILR